MRYPQISCERCFEILADEGEDSNPNCKKCIEQYGFIELLECNEPILRMYGALSSEVVRAFKLQGYILDSFSSDIEALGGMDEVIRLFEIIYSVKREFNEVKRECIE